jgi:hypothetical protein
LLLALSNAGVEGGFSTMNNIHTDKRNGLNFETLASLMKVHLQCPDENYLQGDNKSIQIILQIWEKLPPRIRYGSDKKVQTNLIGSVIGKFISSSTSQVFRMPERLEKEILNSKRKISFIYRDEKPYEFSIDEDYMQQMSKADDVCHSEDFAQMIRSHRIPLEGNNYVKSKGRAIMKLDGRNYVLTHQDSTWAIETSNPKTVIITVGIMEQMSRNRTNALSIKLTGRIFHSLRPKSWLNDEIINAVVILLRLYCRWKYPTGDFVIADIFFYKFYNGNIDNQSKHARVLEC